MKREWVGKRHSSTRQKLQKLVCDKKGQHRLEDLKGMKWT